MIYPFIPLNYNFNAPPNWAPKVMPSINLQMPGLSVNPMNVNVNMNANPMNMGPPPPSNNPMNEPTGMNMNVQMNMGGEMGGGVQMNVNMQPL